MPYSTLILTRNEATNLPRCLDGVAACDDVVVLDSGSTDATAEIAVSHGARVFSRPFDTFADQRNWGVANIPFKHGWILHIDADECVTPPLHDEIVQTCRDDRHSAYLIANKLMFMGRWIRRASMYPSYQARLLKRGEAAYKQSGHGQILAHADRGVGTLLEPYIHFNFSHGLEAWVAKHNRYSTAEAKRIATDQRSLGQALRQVVSRGSPEQRRQALKRCADFLPAKPLARFLYLYVLKGAFLDGLPGFHYCVLMAFYDYLVILKARELRTTTIPPA